MQYAFLNKPSQVPSVLALLAKVPIALTIFLKVIFKAIKITGEQKMHYRLCESYRSNDTVHHQTILHYQLKQNDINKEKDDIVRIMKTQKNVTTTTDNNYDQQIVIHQCSEPTEQAIENYISRKYNPKPFTRKKSVVPTAEVKKTESPAMPE